ncbi:hypothetical protein NLU13_7402 [Sarocladium strictum]|uniref:methionyl-tRNA formyltransferase n=1 Tax=Sarocladium strictum TaxID=5046 RepID=A0AA39GCQ8_SARSR|nr:hypothetical protein NLU13_7402 [Sarocladium strictum]
MFLLSLHRRSIQCIQRRYLSTTTVSSSSHEPLRILFCGSDRFSCASLQALHTEHVKNGKLIEALDVMVLPPKWAGRGNKELREVPCKLLAEKLGLRIHQRSTFREWEPPEGINLIVAVSFGLFVPSRILRGVKYGGLNVHPSLLPDLRGPAPLHHALLNGDKYTGVSLQTLDDKAFDHGAVLAQTSEKGFPIPEDISLPDLTAQLAEVGATMLVQGLRDRLYIPPHKDVSSHSGKGELRHAPKLTKTEAKIDWEAAHQLDSSVLERKLKGVVQVFGSVWTDAVDDFNRKKRVIFKDVRPLRKPEGGEHRKKKVFRLAEGGERDVEVEDGTKRCLIHWGGDVWMDVGKVTVQGSPEKQAADALKGFLVERTTK